MLLTKAQLDRLDTDGYLILENIFSEVEIEALRAEIPKLLAEDCEENQYEAKAEQVRNVLSLHRRSLVYRRLIQDPRLIGPARQIVGPDIYAQQVKINLKSPFYGAGFEWHTDFATHKYRDGVAKSVALNMHILLDKVTEFNGPLVFVPRSHKHDIPSTKSQDGRKWSLWTVPPDVVTDLVNQYGLKAVTGDPGTLVIFGDRILHVSGHNWSPYARNMFSVIYNACDNLPTNEVPQMAHELDRTPITAAETTFLN